MSTDKTLYVTTPIYYVNDAPHIGHSYTTILADVITRYHQLMGYETRFLTGTDEHGQKVQQAAAKREVDPKQHVDEYNVRFKELWEKLEIQYDRFIRTTDEDHKEHVREMLQMLWDKGEIYSKSYGGWYSVSEEQFFGEDELKDGPDGQKLDPVGEKPVEWVEEQNYFFKMSQYQQQLIDHIEANPDFILPEYRKNEVLGFLRQELTDLCISRPKSRLSWGIALPFDEDYVTYVWFDALLNYITGFRNQTFSNGKSVWPADYHLIGKDILTTHSVYWTTMLMGLGLPLPKHILAHGWWLNGGAKMSKSSGTAINPFPYMEQFGVDSFRYFVIRDMALGQDASFTDESFFKRLNSDLANDLGNGLNRVIKMTQKNFDNKIPDTQFADSAEAELKATGEATLSNCLKLLPELKLSQALEEIFVLVRAVNKYLEDRAPWQLAKDPEKRDELAATLKYSAEALRLALQLLQPVMPEKSVEGLKMLGTDHLGEDGLRWGVLEGGMELGKQKALFPRIDVKQYEEKSHPIAKLDFRVAEIIEVADHPDADALYVLQVNDGDGVRTVCAGLKSSYSAEELTGRKAVLFANLKPAKLRGVKSAGMMLAGDGEDGKAKLLNPGEIPVGTKLQWDEFEPAPKAKVSIKDFDKFKLVVKNGVVSCEEMTLHFNKANISCEAPEGAEIH